MILSDSELIEMLREPRTRREGFAVLVKQYSEKLYWKVRRIVLSHEDANDVLQNVFIKVWNNLQNFQGKSSLSTWLYRIAINESLDFLRKQKRNMVVPIEQGIMEALTAHLAESVEQEVEAVMLMEKIRQSFQELTLEQQEVFHLKVECGLKEAEIASLLEVKPSTVKTRFYRARNQLKVIVGELDIA